MTTRKLCFFIVKTLSRFLPIKKERVFFVNFNGLGYGCNPKYIAEEMIKDGGFKIYWMVNPDKNIDYSCFPKDVKILKKDTLSLVYHLFTSKFIISNSRMQLWGWYKKRKNQIYIQTWHGSVCFKKIEGDCTNLHPAYLNTAKRDSKNIDFLLSGSEWRTKKCFNPHTFFYDGPILPYGLPRNDIFFTQKNTAIKSKVKRYFNISEKNIKICIYAPTFRDSHSLDVYKIDYVMLQKALTKRFGGKWVIISRLHPNMIDVHNILPDLEYVYDGSKYPDIQELLAVSDAFITDYSGCAFDFMLTKRPAFIFATDMNDYIKERDFYIHLSDVPFPVATNNTELMNNISDFDEQNYKEALKSFMKTFNGYDDGKASKRFLDFLKQQR